MNKKITNSRQRIIEMMNYFNLNQTEFCKKTGIQKSALSNYLNGVREPRQDQISLMVDPFNINPSWLMGYDVPMFLSGNVPESLNPEDKELLDRYHNASPDDRAIVDLALKRNQQKL